MYYYEYYQSTARSKTKDPFIIFLIVFAAILGLMGLLVAIILFIGACIGEPEIDDQDTELPTREPSIRSSTRTRAQVSVTVTTIFPQRTQRAERETAEEASAEGPPPYTVNAPEKAHVKR